MLLINHVIGQPAHLISQQGFEQGNSENQGKTQNYFLVFVYLPFGLTPPLSTSNCGQFIYHFSRFWELTSYIRGNNRILGEIKRETRDNLEAFPLTLVAGTKHGMKMEGRER